MRIRRIEWDIDAWDDYIYWQSQDKKILRRINNLIKDIRRNPFEGIGKVEPLKENLTGLAELMRRTGLYTQLKKIKLSSCLVATIIEYGAPFSRGYFCA